MPDEQCADNRTGYMCGQCPQEEGLDLTLRNCKKCTALDTILLVMICKWFDAVHARIPKIRSCFCHEYPLYLINALILHPLFD